MFLVITIMKAFFFLILIIPTHQNRTFLLIDFDVKEMISPTCEANKIWLFYTGGVFGSSFHFILKFNSKYIFVVLNYYSKNKWIFPITLTYYFQVAIQLYFNTIWYLISFLTKVRLSQHYHVTIEDCSSNFNNLNNKFHSCL